jgi:periplasmic divalent cation tolerance protein
VTPAVVVVLVTAPDPEIAGELARTLVQEGLAACVNVLPGVRSVYRWQGAVEESDEVLLLIKLGRGGVDRLTRRVQALHPYDLPEVVALPVTGGLEGYLSWVERESDAEAGRGGT